MAAESQWRTNKPRSSYFMLKSPDDENLASAWVMRYHEQCNLSVHAIPDISAYTIQWRWPLDEIPRRVDLGFVAAGVRAMFEILVPEDRMVTLRAEAARR